MNKKAVATDVCADLPPLIETHVDCSLCTIGWPMDNGWLRVSFWGPVCKQYWLVNNNGTAECVHQVAPPANAIGGPFYWSETCVSNGATISNDPYWCLNSKVVQNATKPNPCATGPYNTFQAALAACQDAEVTRYPSMWIMGTDVAYGNFKCLQPGDDAEPNPAIWACDYVVDQYRIQAQVTPEIVNDAPTGGLVVNVTVKRLGPRSIWFTYCTFGATIQEDACTAANPVPWRRRYWKSNYIPVSVNAAGGLGDPVSAAKIEATAVGMRMGCGYPNEWEIDPICGFGDGDGWYTCFRAHIEAPYYSNLNPALPGVLFPLGVRSIPGNNPQNPQQIYFAECDVIYKNQFNQWATRFNSSNGTASAAFIQTYRKIGVAGRAPQEFIDLENLNENTMQALPQQIQIEDRDKLCLKSFGNTGVLWLGYRNPITEEWEVVAPTKVQPLAGDTTSHLHVWVATFPLSNVVVHLYAMRFPSPSILPDACTNAKQPTQRTQYWCVDGDCVESPTLPANASAGPFTSPLDCAEACSQSPPPPPPNKYWCVGGACVEAASQPSGSTGGPYDTPEECAAACASPQEADPFWCVSGSCVQAATAPTGNSGGPYATESECTAACQASDPLVYACTPAGCMQLYESVAISVGYQYFWTTQACAAACIIYYFCGEFGCFSSLSSNPPQATAGPYASTQECLATGCGAEFENGYYWCVLNSDNSTSCVQAIFPPSNFVGGPYSSMAKCGTPCSMLTVENVAQQLPPAQTPEPENPVQTLAARLIADKARVSQSLIERVKSPCKHRGKRLPLMGYG